jgi:hypothetical protein
MFTMLAFGLCASLASIEGAPAVNIGYISRGDCIAPLTVAIGIEPQGFQWLDHDVVVRAIEGGAVLSVDGQETVLQDGEPV